MISHTITLTPYDNQRIVNLCGRFDEHLRLLERHLGIEIIAKGNEFKLIGDIQKINTTANILQVLYKKATKKDSLNPKAIYAILQEYVIESTQENTDLKTNISTSNTTITARNKTQEMYLNNIKKNIINFGIGPAGTGKTFLAVAAAVAALEQQSIKKILLVRPVVEAGEKLGFLPGDLAQKIDPYLRPIYDALFTLLGFNKVNKLIEQQVIEIAPLAYMRGRTLNDAFIILDESQNTTRQQMKMFLTRIGTGSTAIITGDITQIDLPKNIKSGLRHVISIINNIPDISFTFFTATDVVRHSIVQKIITAYEQNEHNEK